MSHQVKIKSRTLSSKEIFWILRENCPNAKLFVVRIFLYLDWIRGFLLIYSEYRKIRTRNNFVFGHFSRSGSSQEIIGYRTDSSNFTVCRLGTLIHFKLVLVTANFSKLSGINECYLFRQGTIDVASWDTQSHFGKAKRFASVYAVPLEILKKEFFWKWIYEVDILICWTGTILRS